METKAEANYRDRPQGSAQCSRCTMFIRGNACTIVEGEISPQGWCKYFERSKS